MNPMNEKNLNSGQELPENATPAAAEQRAEGAPETTPPEVSTCANDRAKSAAGGAESTSGAILPEKEAEASPAETSPAESSPAESSPAEILGGVAEEGAAAREPAGAATAALAFDFDREQPATGEQRGGTRGFAITFAAVTGVCLLLLFLTLWLGDAGFKIIQRVETDRIVYVREYDSASGLLTPNEVADIGRRSTVTVSVVTATGSGIGSGFVYSAEGYIVTNHHVIENAIGDTDATVQVVFSDGYAVDATVIGYNEDADVAVLQVPVSDRLVPVTLGSSAELLTGDAVVAIGSPAKLDYAGTATFGSVSEPKRLVALTDDSGTVDRKMTLIQTDASVNPGNSGGPLLDMYGHVVGIVVMKVTQYGGTVFDGIGFAIPIDGARTVIDAIIQDGAFHGENPVTEGRSLLGVTGHGGQKGYWYSDVATASGSIEASETERPGYHYMTESGVYVMQVNGGNAAGRIMVGDIILRVNGLFVQDTTALIGAVNRCHAGETVTLTVWRGGAEITVELVLAEA